MQLKFRENEWQAAKKRAKLLGPAARALLDKGENYFDLESARLLENSLAAPLLKRPERFTQIEQLYTPSLSMAVGALTDGKYAKRVKKLLEIEAEGRYSSSMTCRSFHTGQLSQLVSDFINLIAGAVRLYYYDNDILELTGMEDGFEKLKLCLDIHVALAIREGDESVRRGIHEAVLGDNSLVRLNGEMICGVIRSGDEALVGDLLKLLDTAGLQEGLRQRILESADIGRAETFARIVCFCAEKDLFRFASGVRALAVWTGFGVENTRANISKRLGNVAAKVLSSEEKRREYLASDDLSEVWLALWGYGCFELGHTLHIVSELIKSGDRRRRLLAWYFISGTENSSYRMKMASENLHERDPEVLAWLTGCLEQTGEFVSAYYYNTTKKAAVNHALPAKKEERRALFDKLAALLPVIGEKTRTFSGMPFDFVSVRLSSDPVIGCMMSLAGYDMDAELAERLTAHTAYMNADRRQVLIRYFLRPAENADHRRVLVSFLGDRSPIVKQRAVEELQKLSLTDAELDGIADSLRSKSSPYRAAAVAALKAQPESRLEPLLERMLASAEEHKLQAALDLICEMEEKRGGAAARFMPQLQALGSEKLSTQTEILLKKLLADGEKQEYTRENGFGLYDPQEVNAYLDSIRAEFAIAPWNEKAIRSVYPSEAEFKALMKRINAVFEKHADYEYEVVDMWHGSREKVLLGDGDFHCRLPAESGCSSMHDKNARLDMLPFCDEFRQAFGETASDPVKAAGLFAVSQNFEGDYNPGYYKNDAWFSALFKKELVPCYAASVRERAMEELMRGGNAGSVRGVEIMTMMALAASECDPHAVFECAFGIYRSVAERIGESNLAREYRKPDGVHGAIRFISGRHDMPVNSRELGIWRELISRLELGQEDFARWFKYEYRLECLAGVDPACGLTADDIFRAHEMGLVPKEAIFARLLREEVERPDKLSMLTGEGGRGGKSRRLKEKYPGAGEIITAVVNRIAEVEERRGELETPLTYHALAIGGLYGAEHFVHLLAALGKEGFYRGYEYTWEKDKRTVLSCLLKRCRPNKEDTPEKLKELIKSTDISESRLLEAVMYCPQWAGIAEKALEIKGLKSAVWFFHAHINESFSAEKETETALFSPISPERFMDGAFDRDWFMESYYALGEKRFNTLYKSAKYISSGGSNHRRSQLYADAVLGRLDIAALEKEIEEKRNVERLRCYPLIPIAEGDMREALRRYEFLQRFMKSSKQFGAQRRESEKKAVGIALENLAITTGIKDVNRLVWRMETQKTKALAPLLEPIFIDEFTARLVINGEGDASVAIEKGGKELKAVPKAIAKHDALLELKASAAELKEQKRRSRESLERAMCERTEFERAELAILLKNPVLAPMIKRLVWLSEGALGFIDLPTEGGGPERGGPERGGPECGEPLLIDPKGELHPCGEKAVIAHPHDMMSAGSWHEFMRLMCEKRIVQPFKQVFREYYPITEDERSAQTLSRRYAGFQVSPKRTAALLKSRGWTVDYEEGLQRVFYRENLVVRLFALADWFSPSDIEAPTLETVQFFDRRSGEPARLCEVPPVLFSEVMRDIDLVVSVAHVGGVDPEASMSTVEMRISLAGELVRLLGLKNVRFTGNHARVEGRLANWSVHMGSGIVHAEGRGMIPIMPVHSQSRGRVFLPFADDDPKTAEIMSKIILLSEDTKLRDPEILKMV